MRLNDFLVPVSDIICNIDNQFDTGVLRRAGQLIHDVERFIRPLVLRKIGSTDQYELIDGAFGYYASVEAEKIDPMRCELINAYVVENDQKENISNQLEILQQVDKPESIVLTATVGSETSAAINQILAIVTQQSEQIKQLTQLVTELTTRVENQSAELASLRNNLSNEVRVPKKSTSSISPVSPIPPISSIPKKEISLTLHEPVSQSPKKSIPELITVEATIEESCIHLLNTMGDKELLLFFTKLKFTKPTIQNIFYAIKNQPIALFKDIGKVKGVGKASLDKLKQALEGRIKTTT